MQNADCYFPGMAVKASSWQEEEQIWRAVSVMFTPEAIFWGTDIGIDRDDQPNYLVRWDRSTGLLSKLIPIDGPAYYSARSTQGIAAVATAVEGGEKRER